MSAIINKAAKQIKNSKEDKTNKQRDKRNITQRYIIIAYNKIRNSNAEVLSRAWGKPGVLDRVRSWPRVKKFSHAARDMYIASSYVAGSEYLGTCTDHNKHVINTYINEYRTVSQHNYNRQIRGGEILYAKLKKAKRVKKSKIKDNKNTRVVPPPIGEPVSTAPLGEARTERGTQGILNEKQKTCKNKNNSRSEERRKARSDIMKDKRIDNCRKHKDTT